MSEAAPEFSRIVRLDAIGRARWPAHIEASEAERTALSRRFGFVDITSLEADYSLTPDRQGILATGEVRASLSQPCVATSEPVTEQVQEAFSIRFVPAENDLPARTDDEVEIDASELDVVPYTNGRIDIGEAVAETLALSVNPFPRSPNADTFLQEAGVLSEDQAGPFAALAALKNK
ncbi:DUF177 domain-containing protein [Sphingobium sp. DEHP117]|uniref:YceD family protein n=1 Tax=Sphingobium sp. DEHP117 TaxID=2993436 RepID=UPI0027D4A094|nr:YceD family protein [Sphingobium sp. DEHP117]MDQ4421074.1 DUF177 domain-containing protein [Sphingobium sp. DEHP117]